MPRCNCAGSTCGCLIVAGSGVTVTGSGTKADPFRVSAVLGRFIEALQFNDTPSVDFTVVGQGTPADPMIVSAVAVRQPFPSFTTSGQPDATVVGAGSYYWDTTTGIPMWSNGAGWVPAVPTGTPGRYAGINAQTGTAYTPVITDQGKLVTLTNAAAITVTLPQDSALAIPIGNTIDFVGLGAGLVTFVAGAGATKNPAATVTRAQYSAATAIKVAANTWLVVGDLA